MWKIAVVDDDRQVLKGMKKQIPWHELDAEWAGEAMDGEQGLALAAHAKPDIIFTDVYMPVMNGLVMAEKLRESGFKGKIIVLSGYSDFEYARQALRLNVFDYLSKPISPQTLRQVLKKVTAALEEESCQLLEREDLQRRLLQYEPFVEREWLVSIVTGACDKLTVNKNREGLVRKYLADRHFLVVGFRIPVQERTRGASASDSHLFRFAAGNIIDEIMQEEWPGGTRIELNSQQSVLLLSQEAGGDSSELPAAAQRLAERTVDSTSRYLRLILQAGIGTLKTGWQTISESTEEAFFALTGGLAEGTAGVTQYREPGEPGAETGAAGLQGEWRPVKFYHSFAALVRQWNPEELKELIRTFTDEWDKHGPAHPAAFQMAAGELLTIMEYTNYDHGRESGMEVDPQLLQSVPLIQDAAGLRGWLNEFLELILRDRQWSDNIRHKKAVEFILDYIHEHYRQEITLNDLTDKVFISRNYLSRLFRSATGETFNSYLTRVRMEKARALIMEGDYLIYEVAEMVGYKSVAYFSNLFKKYTGMNPSDLVKGS